MMDRSFISVKFRLVNPALLARSRLRSGSLSSSPLTFTTVLVQGHLLLCWSRMRMLFADTAHASCLIQACTFHFYCLQLTYFLCTAVFRQLCYPGAVGFMEVWVRPICVGSAPPRRLVHIQQHPV